MACRCFQTSLISSGFRNGLKQVWKWMVKIFPSYNPSGSKYRILSNEKHLQLCNRSWSTYFSSVHLLNIVFNQDKCLQHLKTVRLWWTNRSHWAAFSSKISKTKTSQTSIKLKCFARFYPSLHTGFIPLFSVYQTWLFWTCSVSCEVQSDESWDMEIWF